MVEREYSGGELDYSWKSPPWAGDGETVDVIDDSPLESSKNFDVSLDFKLTDLQYELFEEAVARKEFSRPGLAEYGDCTVQGASRLVDKLLENNIIVEVGREDSLQGTVYYRTVIQQISELQPPEWQFVPSNIEMLKIPPAWRDVLIFAHRHPTNSQKEIAIECDVVQSTVKRVFEKCGDPRVEEDVRNRKRATRISDKAYGRLSRFARSENLSHGEAILKLLDERSAEKGVE